MKHLDPPVREMVERVIEMSRSFAIWWELVEKENFTLHEKILDCHRDFFSGITHSLFQGFSVISYQLFDTRSGTKSLRSLIDSLPDSCSEQQQAMNTKIEEAKPLLKKMRLIRCNLYAHRNKSERPESIFKAAELTPEEMEKILYLAQDIVSTLAEMADVESKADVQAAILLRQQFAREDTSLVIQALKNK